MARTARPLPPACDAGDDLVDQSAGQPDLRRRGDALQERGAGQSAVSCGLVAQTSAMTRTMLCQVWRAPRTTACRSSRRGRRTGRRRGSAPFPGP